MQINGRVTVWAIPAIQVEPLRQAQGRHGQTYIVFRLILSKGANLLGKSTR